MTCLLNKGEINSGVIHVDIKYNTRRGSVYTKFMKQPVGEMEHLTSCQITINFFIGHTQSDFNFSPSAHGLLALSLP